MSISKISFMAESALLNKSQSSIQSNSVAQADGVKTESKADTEGKVQTETPQSESATQESSHSNVKAWGIGLSAAAVLTTLGVLAGRKGYLGESVKKFLGGIKKEKGNLSPNANNLHDGVELPSGNNDSSSHIHTIVFKDSAGIEAPVTIKKSNGEWEIIPPKTSSGEKNVADNVADAIREKAPETPAATHSAASKGEAQVLKAEDIDVDKINASLDRTLPKLDYPMQVEVPETKALLEESKYVLDSLKASDLKSGFQILPNGNKCSYELSPNGTIESYGLYDKEGKSLHEYYRSGTGATFNITKGNCTMRFLSEDKSLFGFVEKVDSNFRLNYNDYGVLDSIDEHANGVNFSRRFEPQTDNGLIVTYYNPLNIRVIKMETFQDGKLETEVFFDGSPSMRTIKEINHEIK